MKVSGNIIAQHCWAIMMYFGGLLLVMVVLRQPVCFSHVFPVRVSLGRYALKSIRGSSTWSKGVDNLDVEVAGNIIVQSCLGNLENFDVLCWVMTVLKQLVCFSLFFH